MSVTPSERDLEHYRILAELASDYAFKFRIDPDGSPQLEWISESWERDFGPVQVGASDPFERVHPEDRVRAAEEMQRLLHGSILEGEMRLLPLSGGELWVHYRVKPILDPKGSVVGTYGVLRDIHERKMAEELWHQAEARFRAQYQGSPIPTYTWQRVGDDLVLIDSNRAAEEITSGGVSRLIGKTARQLYADEPEILADLTDVFDAGRAIDREYEYRFGAAGEVRPLRVTMARVSSNIVLVHTIDPATPGAAPSSATSSD